MDEADDAGDAGDAGESLAEDLASMATLLAAVAAAPAGGESRFLAPGPFAGGTFEIERELGSGGMGVVYLARDMRLDRRVAIKLSRLRQGDEGFDRLAREATAMARLDHPNVVTVYEVDTDGDQLFIVMEYMSGGTLRRWLREADRTPDAILDAFAAVGEGLSAAHEAGITHRDLKPDNVFIAADGRPCIADFGLARAAGIDEGDHEPGGRAAKSAFDSKLTATGATLGTPAYMAPEQFEGGDVDARADQFAFCVALYEALYDQHPFGGSTATEIRERVTAGTVLPPRPDRKAPRWIQRVLLRGLAVDREDRYPDMRALLGALEAGRRRRRRRWRVGAAAVAGLLVAGGGSWAYLGAGGNADPCSDAAARMSGIWDRQVSERTRAGITLGGAEESVWPAIDGRLDDYRERWVAARTEACRATRLRGERSERALDLSVSCLEKQRARLGELISSLASGAPRVVAGAGDALAALPDPDRCHDTGTLGGNLAMPPDEVAEQVEELQRQIGRIEALVSVGEEDEALALAESTVASARGTGYRPVLAETLYLLGRVRRNRVGHAREAVAAFEEALNLAIASGHDDIVASAVTELTFLAGSARSDDAARWFEMGRAAIERLGGDAGREAALRCGYVEALRLGGEPERAVKEAERCLELKRARFGSGHREEGIGLVVLGSARTANGDYAGAERDLVQALEIHLATSGEKSRFTAQALQNLAIAETRLGKLAEAQGHIERAIAIREAIYGGEDLTSASLHGNLAEVLRQRGEPARGLEHATTSVEIERAVLPDDSVRLARSTGNLAIAYAGSGKLGRATELARESLEVLRRAFPEEDDETMPNAYTLLGTLLRYQGKAGEALPLHLRGAELAESVYPEGHPQRVNPLVELGHTQTATGDLEAAMATLSKAVELSRGEGVPPPWTAEAEFALAKVLRMRRAQPARARRLATEARARYRKLGKGFAPQVAEIDAWLE